MATLITKNSSTASAVPAAGDLVKGELAVNVTDKKVYTKDNSAAVVKLVGSLGNQEANAVAVTGGTINGTTIGATTPSTGAFTTASASSGFTGNLTGNVTGNVSGTAANVTGVVAIANGGTGLSALGTGVQTALGQNVTGSGGIVLATSPSLTTPNLGTPSAAVLTNATGLPLTTGVTGTLSVANGGTGITAFGTGVATALGQNVTGSGGIVLATSPSLTTPNLGTPSAATLTNATGLPISTGVSGLGTGVATALAVNTGSSGAFVTNGGALGTPSSGTLTNATGLPLSTGVTGTLATTNGGTGLTSFTANGVVYASSSSALTTGSALSFDGTSKFELSINQNASTVVSASNTTSGTAAYAAYKLASDTNTWLYNFSSGYTTSGRFAAGTTLLDANGTGGLSLNAQNGATTFLIAGSEAMRLTSTGLGIGASLPTDKLHVVGTASRFDKSNSIAVGQIRLLTNTDSYASAWALGQPASSTNFAVQYFNGSSWSDAVTVNTSGNLGLGVTPSNAYSGLRSFEIGANGAIYSETPTGIYNGMTVGLNFYFDAAGTAKYKNSSVQSTRYVQYQGQHAWFTAGSGTAGDPISFGDAKMTLDASGNLVVGATSASARLDVVGGTGIRVNEDGAGTKVISIRSNFAGVGPAINVATNDPLLLQTNNTERARITSGGDLLVGTTSTAGVVTVDQRGSTGTGSVTSAYNHFHANTKYADFLWYGSTIGSITNVNGTAVAYNTSSDYRLKNNQQPLTGSGAFIDALKPKTWNWSTDGSKGVGFIAHEVQEVSPGSVVGTKDAVDEEGKPIMQAMEYGSAEFIANIIAELQSLRARVAHLEAK